MAPKKSSDKDVWKMLRTALVDELVAFWLNCDTREVLDSSSGADLLPERVAAMGFVDRFEVRESMVCVAGTFARPIEVGMQLSVEAGNGALRVKSLKGETLAIHQCGGGIADELSNVPQKQAWCERAKSYTLAEVASVGELNSGEQFVQIRVRYMHRLSAQSLINVLVHAGYATQDDLLGGLGWRVKAGLESAPDLLSTK